MVYIYSSPHTDPELEAMDITQQWVTDDGKNPVNGAKNVVKEIPDTLAEWWWDEINDPNFQYEMTKKPKSVEDCKKLLLRWANTV